MKKIIALFTFMITLVSICLTLSSCFNNEININDYVTVTYSGISGEGQCEIKFDKENFYLDNISKIEFKDENSEKAFYAFYGKDITPIDMIYDEISDVKLSPNTFLQNGDEIELIWEIDYDKIAKYFNVNLMATNKKFMVETLKCRYTSIDEMHNIRNLAKDELNKYFSKNNYTTDATLIDIYYLNDYSLNFIYVCEKSNKISYYCLKLFNVCYDPNDSSTLIFDYDNYSSILGTSSKKSIATVTQTNKNYKFDTDKIIDHNKISIMYE